MSRNVPAPRPTDAELAILRVLWERGPSTVRQVHEVLVVRVGTTELALGAVQAEVTRLLHQAALSGSPWCDGKSLLSDAGATSLRMSDVFKSQKRWRQLIESDGRGRYQLRPKPE